MLAFQVADFRPLVVLQVLGPLAGEPQADLGGVPLDRLVSILR